VVDGCDFLLGELEVATRTFLDVFTLGSMRSSIGFGYPPVKTINAMKGSNTIPSRRRSSRNDELASSGSPWNTRW